MGERKPKCLVCAERSATGLGFCDACRRGLDHAGSTIFDIVAWAARRARRFEHKRSAPADGKDGGR